MLGGLHARCCHAFLVASVLRVGYYYCDRDVQVGDVVTVGECRPLSKTVRFNVLKVSKGTGKSSKKSFQKF